MDITYLLMGIERIFLGIDKNIFPGEAKSGKISYYPLN